MRLYKIHYNEKDDIGEFFFFSKTNALAKYNQLKTEGKKVLSEECFVFDISDFEKELVAEIQRFRLKAGDKEKWEIHTGDIVINRSQWREVKNNLLEKLRWQMRV